MANLPDKSPIPAWKATVPRALLIQPLWLRIAHWINAASVVLMVLSGWQIYDASPIFPALKFPAQVTLGGWLGGALLWHFAGMWLLGANFVVYLAFNISSGRMRRKLLSIRFAALTSDLADVFRGKLEHDDLS